MVYHTYAILVLTVLVFALFVITLLFNGLASMGHSGVFYHSIDDTSDEYATEITPAGWVFPFIWTIIYIWTGLWIIYAIIMTFRWNDTGPLYIQPVLFPAGFLGIFIMSLLFNCFWLFIFDRTEMVAAVVILFLLALSLYFCIGISYRALQLGTEELNNQERTKEIWLIRILVHNGLSVYATWVTVAVMINLAIVLIYRSPHDISNQNACTISLGILTFLILTYLFLDFFVLDIYTRYVFGPHLVLIIAFTAILAGNYMRGGRNCIFVVFLLSAAVTATFIKIFVVFWRRNSLTDRIMDKLKVKA